MPLPIAGAALGLAIEAVPQLVRWIAGDDSKAARVAQEAAGVARAVTGRDSDDASLEALRGDPGAFVEFQKLMADKAVSLAQEETAQLREREQSWREQGKSEDAYVRRARPTIIYALVAIGVSAAATAIMVAWREPVMLPETIAALQWVVYALAGVGGLYVVKRSDDKAAEEGFAPPQGAVRKIAEKVLGK
jgi:hypothetical protein